MKMKLIRLLYTSLLSFVLFINVGFADGPISGGPINTGGAPPTVEVDPIVGTVSGIVEADGAGNISAATEGTDYYAPAGTDVAIVDGGTGQSTAINAFNALKQDASETNKGVLETSTDVEAAAQSAADKSLVPSNLPSIMAAPGTIGKLELDNNVETLAANKTLIITDKVIQKLDPDGVDRNILLPTEATSTDLTFFIYNMGGEVGEDLYIQDDVGAALVTIHYNHFALCTCDGTTWVARCIACVSGTDILNLRAKEENTSALVIGQPVYISGATGVAFPNAGLADCDDSSKIRVKGLVAEAISQNSTGYIRVKGLLENVDSTKGGLVNPNSEDWTAGDQLWVARTVGGLTNVRPISGRTIKAGTALTVEGSNSKILVDVRENPVFASAASGEDLVLRVGDNAGANKVSYRDYANNEVASLDSDGKKIVKQLQWAKGADVASANALVLGADGNYFDITGVASITSIGTLGIGSFVILHFDGILTLTHNATDLILPGTANITTAAGDEAMFEEYATGDWRCVNYSKVDGTAIVETGGEHALVAKTSNYNVLAADLTGLTTFTNDGAGGEITFALPAGVVNYRVGFAVTDAQYLKVTANGTEKFRYGANQGAAGGYIRCNVVGTAWVITWTADDWLISPLSGVLKYDE